MSDKAIDVTLLVYALEKCRNTYGKTKIQKVPFHLEYSLRGAGLSASRFVYIRYHYGPFSRNVEDAYSFLVNRGFLKRTFELTDRGRFLIDLAIPPLLRFNPTHFEAIDRTLERCGQQDGTTLKQEAYDLPIVPDGGDSKNPVRLRDIPFGMALLLPREEGYLTIPPGLVSLICEELSLTNEEIEEADSRIREIEKDAFSHLAEALEAGGQS